MGKNNKDLDRSWRKKILIFNAIIIFLIPLIVFLKKVDLINELKVYFGNVDSMADFFAYYKAKVLHFGALISLGFTLYYKIKEGWKFKWDKYTILIGLFACSIIISALFSRYKMVAIFGYPERFEGAWTWLSYLMFSYSLYLFVETKDDIINMVKPFVYSAGIMSLIGAFQYIDKDLYRSKFGKMLILGSNYKEYADQLVFKVSNGRVYSSLYNPNYVGTMVAMTIPLLVFLFEKVKNIIHRLLMVVIFILSIISLIGSQSTGGFIATITVLVVIIVHYIMRSKHKFKIGIIFALTIGLVLVFAMKTSLFDIQKNKIKAIFNKVEVAENIITGIEIDGPKLKVTNLNGEEVDIYHDNKSIFVYDKDGKLLSNTFKEDDASVLYELPYENWIVRYLKANNYLEILTRKNLDSPWNSFKVHLYTDGYQGKTDMLTNYDGNVPNANIFKNERFASNRGYIWNVSMPLISKKLLIGYGSDVFALEFPQDDLMGSVKNKFLSYTFVDKIHNFHLGVIFNFGLFGYIILLALLFGIKAKLCDYTLMSISILGFAVAGIVNDSTVLLTYMLFILISMNYSREKIK